MSTITADEILRTFKKNLMKTETFEVSEQAFIWKYEIWNYLAELMINNLKLRITLILEIFSNLVKKGFKIKMYKNL